MTMNKIGSSTRQFNATGVGPISMVEKVAVRKIRRTDTEHGD